MIKVQWEAWLFLTYSITLYIPNGCEVRWKAQLILTLPYILPMVVRFNGRHGSFQHAEEGVLEFLHPLFLGLDPLLFVSFSLLIKG